MREFFSHWQSVDSIAADILIHFPLVWVVEWMGKKRADQQLPIWICCRLCLSGPGRSSRCRGGRKNFRWRRPISLLPPVRLLIKWPLLRRRGYMMSLPRLPMSKRAISACIFGQRFLSVAKRSAFFILFQFIFFLKMNKSIFIAPKSTSGNSCV